MYFIKHIKFRDLTTENYFQNVRTERILSKSYYSLKDHRVVSLKFDTIATFLYIIIAKRG